MLLEKTPITSENLSELDKLAVENLKTRKDILEILEKKDIISVIKKISENVYEIENQMAVDKEFEALKLEHKEVFDARIKQIDEFNELLKTDSSVVLYTIPLSYVPEGITVAQMYSIALIINEEIPSPYKDKV